MIKAIVFDLDGTLADTMPSMLKALNLMLDGYGIARIDAAKMLTFINGTVEDFVTSVLPAGIVENQGNKSKAIECYEEFYSETYCETKKCYDGMQEVLEELSGNHILAILSNKQQNYVDKLGRQLFREGLFSQMLGAQIGVPGKPDPTGMRNLLAKIGVRNDEAVYIGDSDVDIITAQNAGVRSISVSWGYRSAEYLRMHGAMSVVDDPIELMHVITSMNSHRV